MTADIVNLRRFKKSKEREADAKTADANRLAFGRTKAERQKSEAVQTLESKRLDGHKLED
ncbi:MAG: DUF4169 family protein [Elstera sp.]|jgi:hypothetical protein|uniref:DUF4169 family protein n=1 Tax=Elstera sp. TaxID=1916664 RepID=UPI0037C0802D